MSSAEVDELCKTLMRLQLVGQSELDDCLHQPGRTNRNVNEFLESLELKGNLTSFQVGRLKKGEIDGLVLGGYKLMYQNASGSFARVFRGCSLRNGKMVGLKVLRQRWAKDPRAVQEFHREAELGKSLQHENIVPIFDVGQEGDQHYLTMEFIEGGNLRDFINIRKKLSPLEATKCVLDMTAGLHYAIGRGFTHRDLKLTNVLMSSQGVAMLVDFGLAGKSIDRHTRDESTQRALEYATLEKNTGAQRDDPRSDLYFVGAIYYELLSGVPPFPRTRDRAERSEFSRYTDVVPIREREPGLPRSVEKIVDRLMQLNPSLRYQNTGELLRDLRLTLAELGDGSGAVAAERSAAEPARKPAPAPLDTIMCIESRPKQQDLLRDYFSKHKYRVLVLGDMQRGLLRVKNAPPNCILIMAESVGAPALPAFREIQKLIEESSIVCVLVLPEKQPELRKQVEETPNSRVVTQPITLRDLRKTFKHARKKLKASDDDAELPTDED